MDAKKSALTKRKSKIILGLSLIIIIIAFILFEEFRMVIGAIAVALFTFEWIMWLLFGEDRYKNKKRINNG